MVDLGWLAAWNSLTFFYLLSGFILAYTYAGQMTAPATNAASGRLALPAFTRYISWRCWSAIPSAARASEPSWPASSWSRAGTRSTPTSPPRGTSPRGRSPAKPSSTSSFPGSSTPSKSSTPRLLRYLLAALVLFIVFGHTTLADPSSIHSTLLAAIFRWTPTPIRRLPEFLVGIALGLLFLKDPRKRGRNWLLWTAIVLDIVLLGTLHGLWISLLVIPDVVLLYELAHGGTGLARLLSTGPLLLLGGASYSVYLLQYPVRNLETIPLLRSRSEVIAARTRLPAAADCGLDSRLPLF